MLKLADLEKEYLVSCAHCAKPMPAWELFCPSCNREQSPPEHAADDAGRSVLPDVSRIDAIEAAAFGESESATPQREEWDSVLPMTAANEALGFGLGDVRPGAALPDDSAVTGGALQDESSRGSIDWRRVALGVGATLVVALLVVLMHDTIVLHEDARHLETRAAAATVGRVTGTASRDSPAGADGVPSRSDEGQSTSAASESTAATDRPVEDHASTDEARRASAVSAVQALGLTEPAALLDLKPVAQPAPVLALPVTAMGTTESTNQECTAAQAALALCQTR